jgi:hypothetical protein
MFDHEHRVDLTPGGVLARAFDAEAATVNSVHYQGVDRLGEGLLVEARAPDGVVEAVSATVNGAPVLAVQWHPEWKTERNPQSQAFFQVFGRALRGEGLRPPPPLSSAHPGESRDPSRAGGEHPERNTQHRLGPGLRRDEGQNKKRPRRPPMTAPIRNHDIAELKRLDLAHHLPAQTDYKLQQELGGSRIITRADGVYIHDGEGHQILDGMAGLWCVNVGYGREELAKAAYDQMLELPYYNTFFKTATPPPIRLAPRSPRRWAAA